jgi:hypothetical protein
MLNNHTKRRIDIQDKFLAGDNSTQEVLEIFSNYQRPHAAKQPRFKNMGYPLALLFIAK